MQDRPQRMMQHTTMEARRCADAHGLFPGHLVVVQELQYIGNVVNAMVY